MIPANREILHPPGEYWVGQDLGWGAPFLPVQLAVELPFWLMCPDATINVVAGGHTLAVDIRSEYVELFAAHVIDSRQSTIYIGPHPPALNADVVADVYGQGVAVLARAVQDRSDSSLSLQRRRTGSSLSDKGSRRRTADAYLRALCEAHIEVINQLIRSYRLATYDYFPHELSPWDVPVWRLVAPEGVAVVLLVPYKGWDQKPRVGSFREGPVETLVFIAPADLQSAMTQHESPANLSYSTLST